MRYMIVKDNITNFFVQLLHQHVCCYISRFNKISQTWWRIFLITHVWLEKKRNKESS